MDIKLVVTFREDIALKNGRDADATGIINELKQRAVVENYDVAIRRELAPKEEAINTYKSLIETRPELTEEEKKFLATVKDIKANAVADVTAEKDAEIAKISADLDNAKLQLQDQENDHAASKEKIREFLESLSK